MTPEYSPDLVDVGARPELGNYQSLRGQDGLLAQEKLRLQSYLGTDPTLDKRGLEAIRSRALSDKPSAWANLQNQKIEQQRLAAQGSAAQQAGTAQAQARAQMAARGGFGGGAGERMARQGAFQSMLAKQKASQSANQQVLEAAQQDEQQRLGLLQNLPSMEIAALEPEFKNRDTRLGAAQFDINASLKDKYAEDQWKMNKYQEDMKAYAAGNQANAIAKSGGGGGGGKK
jgi:hypothetical protein